MARHSQMDHAPNILYGVKCIALVPLAVRPICCTSVKYIALVPLAVPLRTIVVQPLACRPYMFNLTGLQETSGFEMCFCYRIPAPFGAGAPT